MRTSIGEFLFILRKSKGMTQQEVADRLGVSNKTVSSWETGASCPDISLLPAIAELYGVTCDELLRGERAPSGQPDNPARREKALGRLLAQYKNSAFYMTLVGIALYAAAVIVTLAVGCAALESLAAFFVGLLLLIAGILTVVLWSKNLRFRLTQDDFESPAAEALLRHISKMQTALLFSGTGVFGFLLPHAFIPVHCGLHFAHALLYGLLGAACFTLAALPSFAIVRRARHSRRTTPEKFDWTLKHGVIPYFLILAAGIAATLLVAYFTPVREATSDISNPEDLFASYADMTESLAESDLFSQNAHTLHEGGAVTTADEQTLREAITAFTVYTSYDVRSAIYFFEGLSAEQAHGYRAESGEHGVFITVDVLVFTLQNGETVACPVLREGVAIESVRCYEASADGTYVIACSFAPLTQPDTQDTPNIPLIATVATASAFIAALAVYTAVYLPQRKHFLRRSAPEQPDIQINK